MKGEDFIARKHFDVSAKWDQSILELGQCNSAGFIQYKHLFVKKYKILI